MNNNKNETQISGNAISSTLEQMSLLGDIGKQILKNFGLSKINSQQKYSHKIRTGIHNEARKRFGEESLFFYGITLLDGYKLLTETLGGDPLVRFIQKNKNSLSSSKISFRRSSRDRYLQEVGNYGTSLLLNSIFVPEKNIAGFYFHNSLRDNFECIVTTAVTVENESFVRGLLTYYLSPLLQNWKFEIKFIKNKSVSRKSGTTSLVFEIGFEKNNTNKSVSEILSKLINISKENFFKNVLIDSNKQKKKSDLMAFQLGKFVPPQIHKVMMEGNYNSSINTKRKKLTVFFSDIENFTETSENLQPEDLTKYLNEYFSEMTKIALKNGATIDKYIGDALMVFFGDPVSQGESQDARLCVEMALQMNEKIKELRVKWLNEGFANPFKIRIGINTGYCNVGNFGSEQRLTYTIIGGEVNVAARLESIGVAGEILISYETLAHVKDMINFKQKTAIKMKGIKREIKVYSVLSRNMQMIPNERNEEMKYLIQQNLNKSLELLDHIKKEDFLRLQKLIIDFKNNINQI